MRSRQISAWRFGVLLLGLFSLGFLLGTSFLLRAHADTATSTLQTQIDQSTAQITQLKNDIAQLQVQLNATSKQKQTLQSAITTLDLNIKKITASIALTNAQISQKDHEIQKISGNIATTTSSIGSAKNEIGDSLDQLAQLDDEPLSVVLLGGGTLSTFFDDAMKLSALRSGLSDKINQLSSLKVTLISNKNTAQVKRNDLAGLQQNLAQQQQSLAIARQTQSDLLVQTKNQESVYQKSLAQKKAQEQKFESDLLNFENQLNLKVAKGSIPAAGSAVLAWPVADPYITQYFGNTPFSTANPQVYNGKGHNAIDLRASPGTPIMAARSGIVMGTGNTDLTCPGASYGKWIFIQHDNGLSTIYAHLSLIGVAKGDSVTTGEVIGYSDTTGYATGPHLHFGVYASSGAEVASFASKGCPGKTYTMPVGDISAYLNPLSYLPALSN